MNEESAGVSSSEKVKVGADVGLDGRVGPARRREFNNKVVNAAAANVAVLLSLFAGGEDQRVIAAAAIDGVIAGAAVEHVISGVAEQEVISRAARRDVIACARENQVVARARVDHIIAAQSEDQVILVRSEKGVISVISNAQCHINYLRFSPKRSQAYTAWLNGGNSLLVTRPSLNREKEAECERQCAVCKMKHRRLAQQPGGDRLQ